jgi:hypothetical protein
MADMAISKSPGKPADVHLANEKETDVEGNGIQDIVEQQNPDEPYSIFSHRMKIWIIILVSISALISPFGAAMFLPALNVLSDVLHITPTQVNISVTTYMVCKDEFFPNSLLLFFSPSFPPFDNH